MFCKHENGRTDRITADPLSSIILLGTKCFISHSKEQGCVIGNMLFGGHLHTCAGHITGIKIMFNVAVGTIFISQLC